MVTVAITHVAAEHQAIFYSIAMCVAENVRAGLVIFMFGTIIIIIIFIWEVCGVE